MTEANTEKRIQINLWRQHIIEGLLKARRAAGKIIEIIDTEEDPKKHLVEKYLFTDYQAQSILELNRPIDGIDEESLVAEQWRLKAEEAELNTGPSGDDASDQKPSGDFLNRLAGKR